MACQTKLSFALLVVAVALTGCSGLKLKLVDASVQKPSNVCVYFTVDTAEGEPVPGMTADQFNIYEDGKLISTYESKQTILNPEVATIRYTLLLLDMSGSVVESGQVPLVEEAAGAFLSNVGEQEQVAIYAFDGRAEIQPIAEFGSRAQKLENRTARMSSWKTEDPSTNLNGAIIEATKVIQEEMDTAEVPLRFGNLVVFTDGTDRAHRATSSEALRAVKDAHLNIYVIGLGGEVDQDEMKKLGRDGFVHATDKEAVVQAFEKVAARIEGLASRFYLLSYCSPARAGNHKLQVEAVVGEERGKLDYQFDATDFEPDCDPEDPPAFNVPGTKTKGGKMKLQPGAPGEAKKGKGKAKGGGKAKAGDGKAKAKAEGGVNLGGGSKSDKPAKTDEPPPPSF
jgi:uncharacterized protein YegL